MAGPRYCLATVALVGVLVGCRCAENVPPANDCGGPGKTCAVDLLAVTTATPPASATTTRTGATTARTTATTARTTPRTTASKIDLAGNASGRAAVMVRYDVSGNDAGDRGAALKEIVSMDETFRRDTGTVDHGGTSKDDGSSNVGVAKPAGNNVHNATAPEPNAPTLINAKTTSPAANNTNVTVTPVIITTTTTTTTTSITTMRANVVRNDVQVVRFVSNKYCYCDLIYGSCDMDCCCDTDCTNHDLKSFTSCSDHSESSSSIKPESILFDSSLFYVVVENVPSDYFYPERDAIESESQVATSLRNRDVFTWLHGEKSGKLPGPLPSQPHRTDSTYNSYDLTHKSLRWMYSDAHGDHNSSEIKTFGLKNRAFDSLCTIEQPVEYLKAKETNCQTFVSNLTDACNNGSSLSFESYFGDRGVFKVVQPFYSSSQKTEKFGLVAIRATAHHRCVSADGSPYDCRVPPPPRHDNAGPSPAPSQHYHPVYSGGACRRVVDAVEYRLWHNGTGGVRAVDVHFHHRDVTDVGRPVYVGQTFSARFSRVAKATAVGGTEPEPYERSGKPGYVTGRPLLVAAATAGRSPRPEPMGLPEPDGHGTCGHGESNVAGPPSTRRPPRRRTVNFLEAVDVRCRVRIRLQTHRRRSSQWSKRADEPAVGVSASAETCRDIQNETVAALGNYEGTLVASLGDPDMTRWTPVVVVKPPVQRSPPTDDSCPAVIDSVHIRVLYSYVGTFDRPQATVLGVLVNYTATTVAVSTETILDRRNNNTSSNNSRSSSNNNENNNNGDAAGNNTFVVAEIPIRATVVFVDLTRPPIRTFAEPPTYEFRLPEDFYYPFWSSSDSGAGGRPPDPTRPSRSSSVVNLTRFKTKFFFLSLAAIVIVHGN